MISLDFELGWGNLQRMEVDPAYRQCVLNARHVVPKLLELFEEFDVSATWAVVGILFGDDRREWRGKAGAGPKADFVPPGLDLSRPLDESTNPELLAPSLVREIVRARKHEIATHTFSHFFWMDGDGSEEAFRQELKAARKVAEWWKAPLRSIVFPRNQYEPVLAPILLAEGVTAYRGNPRSRMWEFEDSSDANRSWRRAGRLLDAYLPVLPRRTVGWNEVLEPAGVSNVRASFFLRPFTPALRSLEGLRLARMKGCLRAAAERGEILHLWWHPHNFGSHMAENLAFLRSLLEAFDAYRTSHEMKSLTMSHVDRAAREVAAGEQATPKTRGRAW